MIRSVLKMGHPTLLMCAKPVENFDTGSLRELIIDMKDTMVAESGAGLAAPQIGVSLRVVIFSVDSNPRYPDAESVPETVLINPVITPIENVKENDWEGCLSVPGMSGLVPRYKEIHYQGFDQYGQKIDRRVSNFHARVVQHECDHLDGILYPMRVEDFRNFGFNNELERG